MFFLQPLLRNAAFVSRRSLKTLFERDLAKKIGWEAAVSAGELFESLKKGASKQV
jgi:hypothetical protein